MGVGINEKLIHQILIRKKCNILWNRDDNASMNITFIAKRIWQGKDRPKAFCRTRQSLILNVAAASHPSEMTA
ncbi:hypothetical protein CU098_004947 [Rhizopus stolonifer]|uniref:Uncharacterized protein n=1 Tax=Rhizopus stolonifer TaxID=4846 RepID=A0A367KUH6_RHIST|nr:hypothetical protein CU098_004947 [Rhizopus stolonifer]